MEKGIKNVIFDFGGVLVDLDKQATLKAFRALGFDAEAFVGTYGQSGLFGDQERGVISTDEFCAEVARLSVSFGAGGQAVAAPTPDAICDAWNQMLVRIPPRRLQALLALRGRYRLFLLSNTNEIHWQYAQATGFSWQGHRAEDFFERIFLSYELHLLKPDEAIFSHVLTEAGIRAEETLFIDDSAENCAAASCLGIQTFTPAEADDWLPLFL